MNDRVILKDTKQDLTQPRTSYWKRMEEDTSNVLRRQTARGRRVKLDDTEMMLSVNSQRNIDKNFEGTNVDWTVVEKQLLTWAHSVTSRQEDPTSDIDQLRRRHCIIHHPILPVPVGVS